MRPARALALTTALGLVCACGTEPKDLPQLSFDHASKIAFFCVIDGAVVGSSRCGEADARLHALVLQSARGEVASVDLVDNRIVDTQVVVPGFTFDPVGELPSAIVLPQSADASYAFVANAGQLDLFARPTQRFLGVNVSDPGDEMPLGSAAVDLVLSPDETTLYAAVPDLGAVLAIPVDDDPTTAGVLGDPVPLLLTDTIPGGTPAEPRPDYCVSCDDACARVVDPFPHDAFGNALPFPPRSAPARFGDTPRPVSLEVDAENGLLLVADESLPIVHVIDIDAGNVELEPLAVGAPTVDIELTPKVPEVAGGTSATERFLYAIDATERSVLVADYDLAPGSRQPVATVIPVGARGDRPVDRLALPTGARVLEAFSTSDYSPAGPFDACGGEGVGATQLCGVFVAVGAMDGAIYIVDVYDLDTPARTTAEECANAGAIVRRHRIRLGDSRRGRREDRDRPRCHARRGACGRGHER